MEYRPRRQMEREMVVTDTLRRRYSGPSLQPNEAVRAYCCTQAIQLPRVSKDVKLAGIPGMFQKHRPRRSNTESQGLFGRNFIVSIYTICWPGMAESSWKKHHAFVV